MQQFHDSQGRTWSVVINVGAIKRVRDLLGVDLLDVANGELLSRLADDACLLVDVIFGLCQPEAVAKGVTDEDFGRGMVGGALDEAASALMKELLVFFPNAQRVRALGKVAVKIAEQEKAVAEAAEAMKPLLDAARAASDIGDSSGSSPASSGSTPPA